MGVTTEQAPPLQLHALLADRFSPHQFDPSGHVDDAMVELLLEAARWAPSAGNSQPWGFFPVRPGEPDHARVIRHLARSSAQWAPNAGLLIVNLARRFVDESELLYSEFAEYDLGQAVAHLTVQAQAVGLSCHQFRAFNKDGLTAELRPNAGWEITSMTAVGIAADRGQPTRWRRSVAELRTAPWNT